MIKNIIILCVFFISTCGIINAQEWSKEDSLWLINILDGKYDLKINEDTKKAIEDGTLVLPSWMKNKEGDIIHLDIIRDLDNTGIPDSARIHSVDPYSMPPAVFAMYALYMNKMDSINKNSALVLSAEEKNKLLEAMPPSARYRFYYNEGGGGIGGQDFNHILSMIFSPSYRRKYHNRKNALVYEGYFDTNEVKSFKMNERERDRLRQSVINIKASSVKTSGQRRNGIDD